ncbi:metal ABC transporter solute-binding protein, Zn/Mn family [Nodularia spumigena]|uniref:Zinc ABC transporter substrate-binding protein n=2 Tax=Nodularia spumigena TaxID=70799 RepID=A0ABU5UQW5_NODSP|nr:zinc ABC transporter substrate-binding protein [Nodularia spumigena]MEA5526189.1 zinc ABC transporter substrate-binding protein [Nodularia spumigena UHCC 0143]MEA5607980.1 zinc ABC transporter substrate-binding protein [Nodularia spumigena UHCC 0060]MEA5612632.1 zinc ABC transporter substrate-binding protein [Nodularia spumigena UHCC 0040]
MMLKKLLSNNSLRATLAVFTITFFGCGNQAASTSFTQTTTRIDETLPRVVATTTVICDLTRQVAENTINLICLGSPGNDSYLYQPRPGDPEAIAQANLILYSGYNLKPELSKIVAESQNSAPKIAVNQLAVTQPQQFQVSGQNLPNPHIWHNPQNTIKMVEVISNNLQKLQPDNATLYSSNTTAIKNQLTQLDSWIKSRIDTIPDNQRKLVTTSNILNYYATAYKIPLVVGLNGIGSGVNITDTQIKNWARTIQQAQVPTIFADTTINPQLIEPVATEANVRVSRRLLYTNGLSEPGSEADTYQKLMVANTRTIVEGLGGTYLIFTPKAAQ